MHTVKRLVTNFTANHYDISLVIHRTERTFSGTSMVRGTLAGQDIILHAHGLTIQSVTVNGKTSEWALGQDDELTIHAGKPGDYTVVIGYSGTINDQLHGLYPCKYTVDGKQKELLATQFESHYAREVFPCVDEPAAKATFDLTLTTETGVSVLGNMPAKHSHIENDSLVTVFETTPKMSTYLLAFVIGDLQMKEGKTSNDVDVRVFATKAQSSASLNFALDHAIKTIEFFEEYFGTPYPLPKSDQVALPDFSNGAMENWGLVTYRESALLYDPNVTSIASERYIATVISHELSHQWFGNLVTMAWWDDLWLNESFATVMEHICVDALYPDWNIWLDFTISDAVYAMRRDSLDGVQSVKVDVHHPDEIQSIFDGAIVYAKGARLMRMLQMFVGEDAFRQGLRAYFAAHAYSNTTGADLWESLGTASGKDVASFMNAWLTQSGFPVVHAANGGKLSQEQFFIGPHQPSSKLWPIPLDSTVAGFDMLREQSKQFAVTAPYQLNVHDTGHYLTHYDDALFAAVLQTIANNSASVTTRAQLLKEQALLAKSPLVSSATFIELLQAYKQETNQKVWSMISGLLNDLKRFVDPDTPEEKALKNLALQVAEPLYKTLGWEPKPGESAEDTMLRATIIGTMIYGEHEDAIAKAHQLYETRKLEQMDAELRDIILIAEVRHGDTPAVITKLLAEYKVTQSVDIKNDICDAVTSTRDKKEIAALLSLLKDTSYIRTQDTIMWYVRLLMNRHGRDMTWQWLQKEWPWITTTFGGDKSYDSFVKYTAQVLGERNQLEQYTSFFTPMLNDPALKRAIEVGINDIAARVELVEADKPSVTKRLLEL